MAESTQEETVLQHTLVGELLAQGHTNLHIVETLQSTFVISAEASQSILRDVYDSWISIRANLNLQTADDRNWHQHLRMQLLQKSLAIESIPSQNLALRILDSLANIQGVMTTVELVTPLPIILVDAESLDEEEPEPKEPTIDKGV